MVGSAPFIPKSVRSGQIRMTSHMKEKYGPVSGMFAGSTPVVFVTDFNLVKELYKVRENLSLS